MLNLSDAITTLNKVAGVMESLGINYWLDSGTLLGAYRDKSFNLYDHDIDIRCKGSEISDEKMADLVRTLWVNGFRDIEGLKPFRSQVLFCDDLHVVVDFKFCQENDKYVWSYAWREPEPSPILHVFPKEFFEKLGNINLYGKEYPCPIPVEDYILHHYGPDWRMFKVRAEEAEETDVSWDYMKDPPCAMTQGQFFALQRTNPFNLFEV